MYKFCYTLKVLDSNGMEKELFCVDTGVSKEKLQEQYGMMLTDTDCYNIIQAKIPKDAIGVREVSFEEHENKDRTYREAWCDSLPDDKINIDMTKVKEIALSRLREMREQSFKDMGYGNKIDPSIEAALVPPETRKKLQDLRDITNPLKGLDTKDKYDDDHILDLINQLSDKKVLDNIVKGK